MLKGGYSLKYIPPQDVASPKLGGHSSAIRDKRYN